MQKYGLDIYIQTVRTEYISKSLNRSLRVCVLHSTPCLYVPPALLSSYSWFSGLLGLGSRGSATDAEILSVCVLPSHPHECRRYFI